MPAGLLVRASADEIARHFLALAALQPVAHTPAGLVCAPRSAPELAGPALARCPLPTETLTRVPGWPDPPAAAVAGWYRRSPAHAPAPAGVRELVQVAGEGFGPVGHATTAMCLGHLPLMPAGPALDAGCGSGLLGQAWAYDRRGTVIGCDLDDRALAQARASRDAAGLGEVIRLHRAALESIPHDLLDGRVLLANVPEPAHRALLSRLEDPPPGAVISGLRPARAGAIIDAYASHGMRIVRVSVAGGFCAASLIRA